jgi:HlyD family secretion protein
VPNAALRFKPDTATLAAMGATAPNSLRADDRALWLLRGEQPVSEVIKIGISDGTTTEVRSGEVRPGDRAIVEAVPTEPPKRGP